MANRANRASTSARTLTLAGRVAVVTGSSRGAGRAIAHELGRLGATVFVTGRSSRLGQSTEGLPGTIEQTASEVSELGGVGIPVRVDHTVEGEVRALFERVSGEARRLDILVNNAWGGYEQYDGAGFDLPFWEQPLDQRWNGMFVAGLRAMFVSNRWAAPLLLETARAHGGPSRPLAVINTVAWAHNVYLGNLYYDVVKSAIIRMSFGMATELRGRHIAVLAVAPGFMRTERVMAEHAKHPFDLGATESPVYVGRAVAALASDPEIMAASGKLLTAGDAARRYGFTDEDGRQPEAFRIPDPASASQS
jgi:NAD(P)-dependent dehydrogenase (short-subunit alcohol dehydrogenase family)